MSNANARQVAGKHYGGGAYQHWDFVIDNELNYFEGQITKYVMRCRRKNGLEDLEKARHFLEKYIEQYSRMNKLPAEVVRVLPRTQAEMDIEYGEQETAKMLFQPDGFSGDGSNGYQCVVCRTVVRANSPLGAFRQHPMAATLGHRPPARPEGPMSGPQPMEKGYAAHAAPMQQGS